MYHQRFKTEEERFSEKYEVKASGCWEWKTNTPYPYFYAHGRYLKAARYIWQKTHNVVLKREECVCHTCDNSICVNPDHLFIGTHTENMRDKARKNRTFKPTGTLNGRAKITMATARSIRRRYSSGKESQQKIADEVGISQAVVSEVILNKIWRE